MNAATTILFYDVECTGLPLYSERSTHERQPRVFQLAAELCIEATGETIAELNHFILPCGWTIPEDVVQLTGVTTELALMKGVAADLVLPEFIGLWQQAGMRAGHNEKFDARLIRIELVRSPTFANQLVAGVPFEDHWKAAPSFCTQGGSTKIVNAGRPAGDKKKTASLSEAYMHFTGKTLDGAHDAMVDVRAAKAVYYGIKRHNAGGSLPAAAPAPAAAPTCGGVMEVWDANDYRCNKCGHGATYRAADKLCTQPAKEAAAA